MATDFFDALHQVVESKLVLQPDPQNLLLLAEEHNQGEGTLGESVWLKKRGKIFAFSLDQKGLDVFPFFKNTTGGIKKKNDAILFCQDGTDCFVFIIELKSGNPGDGVIQLKAGRNFVDYLLRTIDLHFNKQFECQYRHIIFHTRKSAQKGTFRRAKREPSTVGELQVYFEKCNQTYSIDEFF
ncbi:hypothetical protein [Tumebacillus permanentifrigoris]|uniref:Uncharacterized protein n=1 Tax=Tumebacillus permanentifrigoris TaxID=378543 RepID=A0A316DQP7_9BACL|nr:hypothetical protein [Tumebacillus permanentifrigoris]PWK05962.1 hypothetical protein C7459_12125 [Tumebacillus permanentifrigoris]